MISIYDCASRTAALDKSVPAPLRELLAAHLNLAKASQLLDQTHILVIQAGDTENAIVKEIGFSPVVDPITGARFGTDGFRPYWAWLKDTGGWYEMVVTLGNSGFAYILLVEDSDGVLPDLLALCRTYSQEADA